MARAMFYIKPFSLDPTLVQCTVRWINDDGTQSTASWAGSENAVIRTITNMQYRLRFVVDSKDITDNLGFQLEFKKKNDPDSSYLAVPVQ